MDAELHLDLDAAALLDADTEIRILTNFQYGIKAQKLTLTIDSTGHKWNVKIVPTQESRLSLWQIQDERS